MEIREKDILDKTHYGLNIYSHVLRQYYSDEIVIHLSGKQCKPLKTIQKPLIFIIKIGYLFMRILATQSLMAILFHSLRFITNLLDRSFYKS